jgi:hypothetical protein
MKINHLFHAFLIVSASAFLISCAQLPLTGTLTYRDTESGAKGGIQFTPGQKPTAFLRVESGK